MSWLEKFANVSLLNRIEQLQKGIEQLKSQHIADFTNLHDLMQSSLNTIAARDRMRLMRMKKEQEGEASDTPRDSHLNYKIGQTVP